MENEEESDFISGEFNFETDNTLGLSEISSNTEFCLVFEDEVMEDEDPPETSNNSKDSLQRSTSFQTSKQQEDSADVDVEAIKKKANEIASTLQKFRSGNKTLDTTDEPSNYEPPEEFKRYHEKSLYVAQKLKEDRLLFEESKKRNEAVFDKVRSAKRMHKDISDISKEENVSFDEIHLMKLKIERLESTIDQLQGSLEEKNKIISEKNESIRSLSDSVTSSYNAHMNALEQSQEEVQQLKEEYAKNLDKIACSKEQFCNQLQTVRQKYLQIENDLKLSDFARCRLVSRNAQLREKINQLEGENETLKTDLYGKENKENIEEEEISPVPGPHYISKDLLNPKLENIQLVVNEFYSFLLDSVMSNTEFVDDDCCIEDDDYVTKTMEKICDKLESMFYLAKDKIHSIPQIEDSLKQSDEKIKQLERLNDENKQQETKLKKLLATMKLKIQTESNQNKELVEELSRAKERIQVLETHADQAGWKTKYIELENLNVSISQQLNALQESAREAENEYTRLRDENNEMAMMLEMKGREYDTLLADYEVLRKAQEDGSSSDKTENDFVVLQKKDAECEDKSEDTWKEKYEALCLDNDKLMTSIRSMSEKTIEWENEKLTMRNYFEEYQELQTEYQKVLESLDLAERQIEEVVLEKRKAEKEIETLNGKLDYLEAQLMKSEETIDDAETNIGKLNDKLKSAEELNEKLKFEVGGLRERPSSICDESAVKEMRSKIVALEAEKERLLEECDKFKVKYQRLQVYCKANINKSDKPETTGTGDLEKLRTKCKELLVANKQLKEALNKSSSSDDHLNQLEARNVDLQEQLRTLAEENSEINAIKVTCDELRTSNNRLQETLANLQQEITNKVEELERLKAENQYQSSEMESFDREHERIKQESQTYLHNYMTLKRENDELAQNQRSDEDQSFLRELEWLRQDNQAQKECNLQSVQQIEALGKEIEYLKRIKTQLDEQLDSVREEAENLKRELDRVISENQNLDATNEQLMEFCDKARQQIALLNQNDEAYGVEVKSLQERCDQLEAANKELSNDRVKDEVERLKSENDMLVATNEQMMEYCNNAKLKIDELQANVTMSQNYETQLSELRYQLQHSTNEQKESSNNAKILLESELNFVQEELSRYQQQLLERTEDVNQRQLELERVNEEWRQFQSRMAGEVDRLTRTIDELNDENESLRNQCAVADECVEFYEALKPFIEPAQSKSEEAALLTDRLRNQNAIQISKAVQCDDLLETMRKTYEDALSEEKRKYDSILSLVVTKANDLVECWEKVENDLAQKERILLQYKAQVEEERLKYEDVRQNAGTDSLTYQAIANDERVKYERSLAELQQNQARDLEKYKSLIAEESSKYENIIAAMQVNLQHYKSLVEEERAKYERIIVEMQQNADKVKSENYLEVLEEERVSFNRIIYDIQQQAESERLRYENIVYEYQQKLEDCLILLKQKDLKSPAEDVGVQINESDFPSKIDFFDQNASHQVSELKIFDARQTKEETVPSVKKYYDYCKGVIKKEITDILQPDEPAGDWADTHIDVEDAPSKSTDNLATVLEQLKNKFAKTSFSNEWSIDDNLDDFHIALQLSDLFQLVVSYYIDTPKSRESPYALELLKKFKDVSYFAEDPSLPEPDVPVSDERYGRLMITVQRLEQENKYLVEAVTFFENLLTEYSNFESEIRITDLVYRWRENIVFDSGVTYFESNAILDDGKVLPEKCNSEFVEAFAQWKESNVKRIEVLSIRNEIRDSNRTAENILIEVYRILETVKNKMHELICDLHYTYSAGNSEVNPVEFFEQIEDVNHWVEQSLKIILNDEGVRQDVAQIMGDSDEHQHSHDDYDESQSDGTSYERQIVRDEKVDNTVMELKSLLSDSNKKIESLMKEIMDMKNSREYNEVKQLHTKLDETLYQLHVRDVHCVELTQELTQLLSERDALQLKLSTILRQNEELRDASFNLGAVDRDPSNLENKLEELQKVNYMKDPRISEPSKLHHASQMQLFSDDSSDSQKNKDKESGGFSVPSLFKWITGDTEDH